jgi:hypothetical protein
MGTPYNQETILITNAIHPHSLNRAVWWYLGCDNDNIYAEITVQHQSILFRVDGGDPYSAHCQYGLQYCEIAYKDDIIKLENLYEIDGFRTVKVSENCTISVIYYKA